MQFLLLYLIVLVHISFPFIDLLNLNLAIFWQGKGPVEGADRIKQDKWAVPFKENPPQQESGSDFKAWKEEWYQTEHMLEYREH